MYKQLMSSALLAASAAATSDLTWSDNGQFSITHPAFIDVTQFEDTPDDKFLLISTFSGTPHVNGKVVIVPDITDAVAQRDISGLSTTNLKSSATFLWPNDIKVIPQDVFGCRAIVVPDGFLVPGKSDGAVYVLTIDEDDKTSVTGTYHISTEESGYFYHMGEWIDLNSDGRKDFLTARSNAAAGEGQLVWFEQPAEGLSGTWTEHVLCTGCADVGITVQEDDQFPGSWVVFAAQFFDETISFSLVDKATGEWQGKYIIDDTEILSAYMVTYADINADGVKELIVNNHETDDDTNGIWAYHFPTDWTTGTFTRSTLASKFKNARSLFVPNMAPGFSYPFYPTTSPAPGEAAHMLVAGDGDHTAHIMTPTDYNFGYDLDTIEDLGGTVGALAWSDLDNDGWNEVWTPNYDDGYIKLFNFNQDLSSTSASQYTE